MPCTHRGLHWHMHDAPEVPLEAGAPSPIAHRGSKETGLSVWPSEGPTQGPPWPHGPRTTQGSDTSVSAGLGCAELPPSPPRLGFTSDPQALPLKMFLAAWLRA